MNRTTQRVERVRRRGYVDGLAGRDRSSFYDIKLPKGSVLEMYRSIYETSWRAGKQERLKQYRAA